MRDSMKKYQYFILASILMLAFFLRFHNIGEHGLAGDEKYSLFVSQFTSYEGNNQKDSVRKPKNPYFTPQEFWSEKDYHGFFDSIARLDTGNGALYTYSLHYWTNVFGLSDQSLRFPSLIFNLLTILVIFAFVKTHFQSVRLALLASFLAAISPFYINYSQVARNYALLYFLSILSTHLLLLIIKKEEKNEKPYGYYLLYGLTVLACELCHFSAFPLFFIHGLYVIFHVRVLRTWIGLSLSMIIPLIGVILWLKSDGGKWLFDYVQNSVKTYNYLAQHSPDEYLSVATVKNITRQIRHVISCAFISSEGLYLHLSGLRNTLLTIVASLAGIIGFILIKSEKLKIALCTSMAIIILVFCTVAKMQFLVLGLNITLLFILINLIWKNRKKEENSLHLFLLSLVILPFIFLIFFSWQDGNTFRIMPRYVGYSYSFGIILIALLIREIWYFKSNAKYVLLTMCCVQFYLLTGIIQNIWLDNPPRYFMSFPEPRKNNPYQLVANKILQNYAEGDTVLYSNHQDTTPGGKDIPSYSVVDAQLTNFYLPKNSQINQRVNQQEPEKIILKKKNGTKIILFDFEGVRFRY